MSIIMGSLLVLSLSLLLGVVNGLPNVLDRPQRDNSLQTISNSSTTVASPLQCNVSSDCWPPDITSPPDISCFENVCVCLSCFTVNVSTGVCQLKDCYDYNVYDGCVDNRRSQLTAFLLSLFFAPFGGGNFYVLQWQLGAIQISLLVVSILSIVCCCCCFLRMPDEESGYWCTYIFCVVFTTGFVFTVVFSVFSWWLADLVYFGLNQRLSGDGCSLKADL